MIRCTNYDTCRSEYPGSAADAERIAGWRIRNVGIVCPSCAAGVRSLTPGFTASIGGWTIVTAIPNDDAIQLRNPIGETSGTIDIRIDGEPVFVASLIAMCGQNGGANLRTLTDAEQIAQQKKRIEELVIDNERLQAKLDGTN